MITTNKNIQSGLVGRIMILPVIALLLGLFAFNLKSRSPFLMPAVKTIRVVVDAGHGGQFTGTVVNGVLEKDLNLLIAKKIQQLAKEYQIEVIMTRENGESAGHSANLHDDLQYRVELAAKENADLFVSIHGNSDQSVNAASGFEIDVPKKTSSVYSGSVRLGSTITQSIRKDYTIAGELKQPETGVMILDQATVPAILIECGNLDKKADFDFIVKDKNQEKIARDILEGIRNYSLESTTYLKNAGGPADTLSEQEMKKLDPNSIYSMTIDKNKGFIYIELKDGKKDVVPITESMKKKQITPEDPEQTSPTGNEQAEATAGAESFASADTTGRIFTKVEVEATYPGGKAAWQTYLSNTLKYPEYAAYHEIQGGVVVEFIVNEDGSLTHVHAISGPKPLRTESIRIVAESGKWIPAQQHGRTVSSYHKQPILYRLERQ